MEIRVNSVPSVNLVIVEMVLATQYQGSVLVVMETGKENDASVVNLSIMVMHAPLDASVSLM